MPAVMIIPGVLLLLSTISTFYIQCNERKTCLLPMPKQNHIKTIAIHKQHNIKHTQRTSSVCTILSENISHRSFSIPKYIIECTNKSTELNICLLKDRSYNLWILSYRNDQVL